MERATGADAAAILALRDSLAHWQIKRGIDQWRPGEISPDNIAIQANAGLWFVIRDPADPADLIATAQVMNSDTRFWGIERGGDGTAGYLHGLMVRRTHAGQGLGAQILEWFEQFVLEAGRTVARLDCQARNATLRNYYRRHGYHECGVNEFGSETGMAPVCLFEKHLVAADDQDGPDVR